MGGSTLKDQHESPIKKRNISQSPVDSNIMTQNAKERHNIGVSSLSKNINGPQPPLQGYLSSLKNSQGKSRTP
jgi:hypothetical protein